MRSRSMIWLFETMGIKCYVLQGGYKSYRRKIREDLAIPFKFCVIGGRTGSGKTGILHYLEKEGQQVIDLEALANHKGSAFGALGEIPQPTTEQFENDLHAQLMQLDRSRKIWIEDESRNIGRCVIPLEIYARMLKSQIIFLDIPREVRACHLVRNYASSDREELKACVRKIEKRLGGERTVEALESIDSGQFYNTAMITLQYYDKAYMHSLEKNHKVYHLLKSDTVDPVFNTGLIRKTLSLR
jgi:tRNA 2-selenouridine synthase